MKTKFKIKHIYIFLILCLGCSYYLKAAPHWDAKSSIQDRVAIFSSSQREELEPLIKRLWNEYQAPFYIITEFEKNYSEQYQNISSFLKQTLNKPKVVLILANTESDTYQFLDFYIRYGGPARVYFYSLGSFRNNHEAYTKLLSIVNDYQQKKQSENKVKGDLSSAIPAILMVSLIGILLGSLYFKWSKELS